MRKTILAVLLAGVMPAVLASPISPDEASFAARGFALRGRTLGVRLGTIVERTQAHATANGIPFYAVKMYGGGTVFLASDTDETPVIAYTSATNDFSTLDPRSPLTALLNRDLAVRAARPSVVCRAETAQEWAELAEAGSLFSGPRLALAGQSGVGDVRVAALVASQWDQGSAGGDYCYNYYTPHHYVCGCVATAMSQVMRYHRHPTEACMPRTHELCMVGYRQTPFTTQGGVYDWENMPLRPDSSMSETNRWAIGKLTSDAGIAAEMQYTSSGSGTFSSFVPEALMVDFGYAQAHFATVYDNFGSSFSATGLGRVILSNLDAGLPVMLGISRWTGSDYDNGHSIVADGYGYQDDKLYIHLNMGWSGSNDLWYNLPKIGAGYGFNVVDEVVYNIMPTETDGCVLSGRITDATGAPVAGAAVTLRDPATDIGLQCVTSSPAGVYAFVSTSGAYRVSAVAPDGVSSGHVGPVVLAGPQEGLYSGWAEYGKPFLCVESELDIGNSWGNDFVVETNAVTLTVVCEAPSGAVVEPLPAVGSRTFARGSDVSVSAPSFAECTNGFATAYARCPCLGFTGTGSVPGVGSTNVLSIVLTNDSKIVWRYSETPSHYRLRTWESFPDWGIYFGYYGGFYSSIWAYDEWLEAGTVRRYDLPDDAADGESFVLRTYYYPPGEEFYRYGLLTMKLCGVLLSEPGSVEEEWQFDAARRYVMPTNLVLKMDRAYDIDFAYLPTIDMWTDDLPSWWVYRHLYGPYVYGLINEISGKVDSDGDSCSNRKEYRDSTDPMDPASRILPFRLLLF